ncbi:acetyl-CoA synthetase-like protein [Thozetella sp. PMI_491]|nr:acetyl-CoA synthetase-like protein [Thozetella sp. PMI_491]
MVTTIDRTRFQLVLEWNKELPQCPESPVHQLIHERAAAQPNQEAVCSWDGSLTYSELDNLSSRLASHLITLGVGPEVIVPLCFEKSRWAVVGILAVLKAGGAILPFEVSQSVARLKTIVSQTQSRVVLSSPSRLSVARELAEHVVLVDEETMQRHKVILSAYPATGSNMAYIIFTSGTTGIPKGVMIEHAQIATTVVHMGQKLGHPAKPRAFQFGSYAFDSCITDIFPTLVYGGTVCIPSEWERENDVAGALRRMKVTFGKFTPSLAGSIVIENVPTLTTLVLGGESVPPALVERWASKLKLMLVYGPTECSAICFHCDASTHELARGEIGVPVGCRPWIVKQDDWNTLAEIGEEGELLIEGPVVGRGYLNNTAKTNEVFIRNPAWMEPLIGQKNSRLYRTGDLATYLDDGTVCYRGRIDSQVKIRGQRVEMEGVEKKLQECLAEADDTEATKVVIEAITPPSLISKHLVAFVCRTESDHFGSLGWDDQLAPTIMTSIPEQRRFSAFVSVIRSKLELILPPYAVPTIWIPIKEIPLLQVSTKADRKLLRAIISNLTTKQLATFTTIPPSNGSSGKATEIGTRLRDLWAEVFTIPSSTIEADDNFFSLGGDSVMAMRLVSIARSRGFSMTVREVFAAPILEDMALTLKEATEEVDLPPFSLIDGQTLGVASLVQLGASQCGIAVEEVEDIYPCSSMQLHYATGYHEANKNVGSEPWNWQSQIIFSLPPEIDLNKFKGVWDSTIRRHQSLRTRLINTPSGIFQLVVSPAVPVVWEQGIELQKYLQDDTSPSRNMRFGDPLIRFATDGPGGDRTFVITAQHIIWDAFSFSLLFKEIEAAYFNDIIQEKLPAMNRFIKFITTADKEAACEFWTAHLEGADTTQLAEFSREKRTFDVAEEKMITSLPSFTSMADYTLSTMIEVAAAFAICSKFGGSDVIFYSDRLGRNLPVEGIQDLRGPTTLFLPVRIHLNGEESAASLLRRTQDFQRAMMPHEHLGWLELREMPHLEETLKHSVNININPNRFASFGKRLGLKYKGTHELCDDPFGLNVSLLDGIIQWSFYYDPSVISGEVVTEILSRTIRVFAKLEKVHLSPDIRVGDLMADLQLLTKNDGECQNGTVEQPQLASTGVAVGDYAENYGMSNGNHSDGASKRKRILGAAPEHINKRVKNTVLSNNGLSANLSSKPLSSQ